MSELKSSLVGSMSTKMDVDDKNREKTVLSFNAEQVAELADAIKNNSDERGLIIDIRTGQSESKTGKKFPSSFLIVRQKGDNKSSGGFKPKNTNETIKSRAARLQASES